MVINKFSIVSHNYNSRVIFLKQYYEERVNPNPPNLQHQGHMCPFFKPANLKSSHLKTTFSLIQIEYHYIYTIYFVYRISISYLILSKLSNSPKFYTLLSITHWRIAYFWPGQCWQTIASATYLAVIVKGVKENANTIPGISCTIDWAVKTLLRCKPNSLLEQKDEFVTWLITLSRHTNA